MDIDQLNKMLDTATNRVNPQDIEWVEACISWAAQHGYSFAKNAATSFGKITGREMVSDQAYYNSHKWKD